ncbi:uncharacterized protein BJ212DRAFT_1533997, partial [Suillus subaureus]
MGSALLLSRDPFMAMVLPISFCTLGFMSDFKGLDYMQVEFTLRQPFKPYEQLMGVFPPARYVHVDSPVLPVTSIYPKESPIHDFYPSIFQIDMNGLGKKMLWQGIALFSTFHRQEKAIGCD